MFASKENFSYKKKNMESLFYLNAQKENKERFEKVLFKN